MYVETEIDELKLTYGNIDYYLTNVVVAANIFEVAGDSLGHPDDPSPMYAVAIEVQIDSVEWYEDEEKSPLTQEIILELVKKSETVEEALYCDYRNEV